jgi:hypothetical protein
LRNVGAIDDSACYIDATFASAKGGGTESGPTRRGKVVKIMAIVDRHGLPLAVLLSAAFSAAFKFMDRNTRYERCHKIDTHCRKSETHLAVRHFETNYI